MKPEIVYIDGYNLAGWFGLMEQVSRGECTLGQARERILGTIRANKYLSRFSIRVIFDAQKKGDYWNKEEEGRRVEVERIGGRILQIFILDEEVDEYLLRLASQKGGPSMIVVTQDKDLKAKLEKKNVRVRQPEYFFMRILR